MTDADDSQPPIRDKYFVLTVIVGLIAWVGVGSAILFYI